MNKIIQTNYGLASSYEGFTEMNYKLNDSLRDKIRRHENRHSTDRHYSKEDFKNDFMSQNAYFFESLKFCILNPECFVGFFPLLYSYYAKSWTWNSSAFFPFLYFGFIFSFVSSLVSGFFFKTNFFIALLVSFLVYTALVAMMNGLLLLYTHIYVRREKWFVYKEVLD